MLACARHLKDQTRIKSWSWFLIFTWRVLPLIKFSERLHQTSNCLLVGTVNGTVSGVKFDILNISGMLSDGRCFSGYPFLGTLYEYFPDCVHRHYLHLNLICFVQIIFLHVQGVEAVLDHFDCAYDGIREVIPPDRNLPKDPIAPAPLSTFLRKVSMFLAMLGTSSYKSLPCCSWAPNSFLTVSISLVLVFSNKICLTMLSLRVIDLGLSAGDFMDPIVLLAGTMCSLTWLAKQWKNWLLSIFLDLHKVKKRIGVGLGILKFSSDLDDTLKVKGVLLNLCSEVVTWYASCHDLQERKNIFTYYFFCLSSASWFRHVSLSHLNFF